MTKCKVFVLACLSTMLLLVNTVQADNPTPTLLYVDMTTGLDSNSCQMSTPCLTVAGALRKYSAGGSYLIQVTETNATVVNILCNTVSSGVVFTSTATTCNISL